MKGVLICILAFGLLMVVLIILGSLAVTGITEFFSGEMKRSEKNSSTEPSNREGLFEDDLLDLTTWEVIKPGFSRKSLLKDDTLDLITMRVMGLGRWDEDKTPDIEIHYADSDK